MKKFLQKNWFIAITLLVANLFFAGSSSLAANITSTGTGGNWNATTSWVGGVVPGALDNVTIANGATVAVTANASCTNLTFGGTSAASTLNISSGVTLAVSATITIPRTNGGVAANTLAVGAGILNAGSIAFTNGGGTNRHQITISTGTVTVAGNVDCTGSTGSATITFTGAGTFNVGGYFLTSINGVGFDNGTLNAGAGTINFDGNAAAQTITVSVYTFNNVLINLSLIHI